MPLFITPRGVRALHRAVLASAGRGGGKVVMNGGGKKAMWVLRQNDEVVIAHFYGAAVTTTSRESARPCSSTTRNKYRPGCDGLHGNAMPGLPAVTKLSLANQ